MRSRFEKTFNYAFTITWSFVVFMWICWAFNLNNLLDCDFEPGYKEEAIYSIGLFPPASVVTVWYDKE